MTTFRSQQCKGGNNNIAKVQLASQLRPEVMVTISNSIDLPERLLVVQNASDGMADVDTSNI